MKSHVLFLFATNDVYFTFHWKLFRLASLKFCINGFVAIIDFLGIINSFILVFLIKENSIGDERSVALLSVRERSEINQYKTRNCE